jgi:hypothetical protein
MSDINISVSRTTRGFSILTFEDTHGREVIVKKSSFISEQAIWVGPVEPKEDGVSPLVLLDRNMVSALLPYLMKFAATGDIQ